VRRRLVLSAHTDSKSQNISIVTRAVCALLFTAGVFVLPIATAPAAIWPGWLHGFSGGLWWTVWLLAMCAGLVLAAMKVENRSPGALDDAGACGVLLEVARVLCEQPPKGVAVRVLLTGAEELGLAGGYHYVRQLRDDPAWREAYYLNLEGVGEGRKIWLTTGTGPDRAADQAAAKTLELAEASCQEHGIAPRRLSRLVGGEADHIPMIEAGLAAVTLMFAGPHGTRIHTSGDGPELLRPDGLELAGRVVLSAVRRLEEV
jgi:Zn-dependent M28 family amino/carboxypeptidase